LKGCRCRNVASGGRRAGTRKLEGLAEPAIFLGREGNESCPRQSARGYRRKEKPMSERKEERRGVEGNDLNSWWGTKYNLHGY
jgi:hypothetical protein